mmetsp:Transcript_29336/g.44196  ORF Transcript_29336/g.44196 Transcript_29336/m.44196 type:complete len:211 (+) Transcript_29336:602-1234(+)
MANSVKTRSKRIRRRPRSPSNPGILRSPESRGSTESPENPESPESRGTPRMASTSTPSTDPTSEKRLTRRRATPSPDGSRRTSAAAERDTKAAPSSTTTSTSSTRRAKDPLPISILALRDLATSVPEDMMLPIPDPIAAATTATTDTMNSWVTPLTDLCKEISILALPASNRSREEEAEALVRADTAKTPEMECLLEVIPWADRTLPEST